MNTCTICKQRGVKKIDKEPPKKSNEATGKMNGFSCEKCKSEFWLDDKCLELFEKMEPPEIKTLEEPNNEDTFNK